MSTEPEVRRIQDEQHKQEFDQARAVLTSRDRLATTLMNALPADNHFLAPGFQGELIPIVFGAGIELDVLVRVGVTTGSHSHDTYGFHQILNGRVRVSVNQDDRPPGEDPEVDLGPGDWVWIPAGVEYTLEIVANPATIRYRHI